MSEEKRTGSPSLKRWVRKHSRFYSHVFRGITRHDCLGMAAEIAFTMMFAMFNGMLLTVAFFSILGAQPELFNSIIYLLGSFLPFELYSLIRKQIVEIALGEKGGIFVFSFAATIWSMTTLMFTLKKNFERSYHIQETRPAWKVRLIALYIAVLATISLALVLVLFLFGLQIARVIENTFGYANILALLIRVLRLPVAFLVATMVASLLYRSLLNVQERFIEILPGALFFCTLWFLSTYGFGLYLKNFPYYNKTYGTLGVFVVLMVWMYITSLSLLIGGEVNAEIYRRNVYERRIQSRKASTG